MSTTHTSAAAVSVADPRSLELRALERSRVLNRVLLVALTVTWGLVALAAVVLSPTGEQGDVTHVGNVELASADDVASLAGVSVLEGSLVVGPGVTSLVGLEALRVVRGDVRIVGTRDLSDLRGLDGLREIGGELFISCGAMSNGAVQGHAAIGERGPVAPERCLQSLAGLERLEWIGASLSVVNSPNLRSFEGLESLRYVRVLTVSNADRLETLRGLEGLRTVGNGLYLRGNASLRSLEGLGLVGRLFSMEIKEHPSLTDITALRSLTAVENQLSLSHNDALEEVMLAGLREVGWLKLWDHAALRAIHLPALRAVAGQLEVRRAPRLQSVSFGLEVEADLVVGQQSFRCDAEGSARREAPSAPLLPAHCRER